MKRFLEYLVWTLVIGGVIYTGNRIQLNLRETGKETFHLLPFMIFGFVFPIFIGMLLRLPRLIVEIKEKRKWRLNGEKLLVIGLPTLYVTFAPLFYSTAFGHKLPFAVDMIQLDLNVTTITGLIFGYVLLDSVKD